MPDLVKNYIGGQWVEAESGTVFASINPATEDVLAEAAHSGPADVAAAVQAAKNAYQNWRLTPAPGRNPV